MNDNKIIHRSVDRTYPDDTDIHMYTVTTNLTLDWIRIFPEFSLWQDNCIYCVELKNKRPFVFAVSSVEGRSDYCELKPLRTETEALLAEIEMNKLLEKAKEEVYVQRTQESGEKESDSNIGGLTPGWYKRRGNLEAYKFRQPL